MINSYLKTTNNKDYWCKLNHQLSGSSQYNQQDKLGTDQCDFILF